MLVSLASAIFYGLASAMRLPLSVTRAHTIICTHWPKCALRVYMTADSLSGLIPSCLLTRSLTGRPDLSSMKVGIVIMLRERLEHNRTRLQIAIRHWMSSAACCSVGDLLSCRFCPDPWSLRPHAGAENTTPGPRWSCGMVVGATKDIGSEQAGKLASPQSRRERHGWS